MTLFWPTLSATVALAATMLIPTPASQPGPAAPPVRLVVLDPGHFHAALVQKSMYPTVSPQVSVFAPAGPDLQAYEDRIRQYNSRADNPTHWKPVVYTGSDYLNRLLTDKPGNVVVLSGNNRRKNGYIPQLVGAGMNVLSDKPMAIDKADFDRLKAAFATAERKKVLLYDIMTERYEITNALQRALAGVPAVFGQLERGTPDNPAVIKESVHHFFKYVSGQPLVRPAWFFDVSQQGEGLVDVTTHLVDLIQWSCFPDVKLNYQTDVAMHSARRWPTTLTPAQFKQVTRQSTYPDYLQNSRRDSLLDVYANGEMVYRLKGVTAKVAVRWNFEPPAGTGDLHYSLMRGSRAHLIIEQGATQQYKPVLYVKPVAGQTTDSFEKALQTALATLQTTYPGLTLIRQGDKWQIGIPERYEVGHEAHFKQVADAYFRYLSARKLPAWEVPNMLAKYYTTTQALQMASR
ncbi:oxidoreductase [Rudanella paleaurantiibacter]|uniref:Oxidoreductase n=1 Tax=Rudanella paleaurantiibacter TaxID=2614655 RepID=A0A7J5TVM7_9BACT|nr:putative oxidoreductase C-terminal domain-containing protein [Rudanella paleaurantiibacter]KAB7728347.1 oxidoreductase [Rudanella paleaurantiibacter]